jgi:hypothetical protein
MVGTFILYKVAGIEPLDIIISDDALTPCRRRQYPQTGG